MAASTFAPLLLALLSTTALLIPHANADTAEVLFVLAQKVQFGQGFVIAGNASSLSWTPTDAPLMELAEGTSSYWLLTEEFDVGLFVEFKPVRVVYDTKEALEWYNGANLNVTVPSGGTNVYIEWNGSTLSMATA